MIHTRLLIVVAIFSTQAIHVNCKQCKLSSGPGNPYPWLIRIWYRKQVDVMMKDRLHIEASHIRQHIAQGALITANRVVSPCTVIKKLNNSRFSLTGYHFTTNGTYDCHLTQTVYKVEHHPRCGDGNLDADFSVWSLRYPFAVEGHPFLFAFRPTNQQFKKAAMYAAINRSHCELPVFTDAALQSQPEIHTNVRFLSLKEYTNLSCGEGDCIKVASKTKNVIVLYRTWDVNGKLQRTKGVPEVNIIGAVPICHVHLFPNGFPVGIAGAVAPLLSKPNREYRFVASFLNIPNIIFQPKRANRTTRIGTHRVKTTHKRIARKRTRTTATTSSTTAAPTENITVSTAFPERKARQMKKRTTPLYLEDWEALEAFLNKNRGDPSSSQRHRSGGPTRIALVMAIFLQSGYILHVTHST